MQSERQRVERSGAARVGLIRGILVIVTAVAIGAFVLSQGLADDDADGGLAAEVVTDGTTPADAEAAADTTDGAGGDTADTADGADGGSAEVAGAEATSDGAMEDSSENGSMGDGTDADGEAMADDETTSTTDDADPAGPEVQTPADVTVLVLNGAGAKGVAGRGSAVLQDAGYDVLAPKNADFLGPSKVLYSDGFEEEAAEVAAAFGVDPVAVVDVLNLDDAPINDTRNANIVVVVGEDGLINV